MNTSTGILSALRRLGIVIAIAIVFLFGLATTVYLSLRSPEVKVPDVVGKDRFEAEHVLGSAGLNYRVRATRPSNQLKADTVLFQLPRAGEVVKAGQTVAMDISRTAKEGETSEAVIEKPADENAKPANANENTAGNENKPKRNKNTNKNANENANANGNRNANNNRPLNRNANSGNVNAGTNLNSNRPALIINNNVNRGNENRRAPVAKPSPAKPKPEIP